MTTTNANADETFLEESFEEEAVQPALNAETDATKIPSEVSSIEVLDEIQAEVPADNPEEESDGAEEEDSEAGATAASNESGAEGVKNLDEDDVKDTKEDLTAKAEEVKEEEDKLYPVMDDPYEWNKCQVTVSLAFLPSDGDARGREVVVAVYTHDDEPLIQSYREADLVAMPKVVTDMFEELKKLLPERASAYADERKKERDEKEKRRAKMAKNKKAAPKTSASKQPASKSASKSAPASTEGQIDLFGDLMK